MTGSPRNNYRRIDSEFYYPGGYDNTGLDTLHRAAQDAEIGSRELRDEIHSLFRNWEIEHGFVEGAGQILLPAGWVVK